MVGNGLSHFYHDTFVSSASSGEHLAIWRCDGYLQSSGGHFGSYVKTDELVGALNPLYILASAELTFRRGFRAGFSENSCRI